MTSRLVYKISIFICVLGLLLVSNHVWAVGKGFFMEKDDKFIFFDDLFINGYLIVEKDISNTAGILGDVLIGNNVNFDPAKSFYVCKDTRTGSVLQNMDCADKVLAWLPTGIETADFDYYQIKTNNIEATGKISLKAVTNINTNNVVKLIDGCFSNTGSTCTVGNNGELMTTNLYLSRLASLKTDNIITLSATTLYFNNINLGPEANLKNQYLCFKRAPATLCSTYGANGDALAPQGSTMCCYLSVIF
jgi:hypothetical protein